MPKSTNKQQSGDTFFQDLYERVLWNSSHDKKYWLRGFYKYAYFFKNPLNVVSFFYLSTNGFSGNDTRCTGSYWEWRHYILYKCVDGLVGTIGLDKTLLLPNVLGELKIVKTDIKTATAVIVQNNYDMHVGNKIRSKR